ncbi:hypothetical protein IEO21_09733 [Rhodonia placenta]|uniref:Uncharacterized protein n=1 Tax=Rhodonia placenta TaxID=104341 RepID=A0A8H7NTS7_9APHY|nr:hypothetical protein IEO21_09733 [Postia placenta]
MNKRGADTGVDSTRLHSVRTTGLWTDQGRAGEGYFRNRNHRGAHACSRYKQNSIYEWPLVSMLELEIVASACHRIWHCL